MKISLKKAIEWMFYAEILRIFNSIPLVGVIFGLVAVVLHLLALYGAGRYDRGYRTAFLLNIAALVIEVIGAIVNSDGVLGMLISVASALVNLGVIYFLCSSTARMLELEGESDLAVFGNKVWKIYLACIIISLILVVVMAIPVINILGSLTVILLSILQVVSCVMLIVFLYRSSRRL